MIALRRHIERIVRPIRASSSRKHRMREELLVHLTQLYHEELARFPTDVARARSAALKRFGNPDGLRKELQQAVPALEQSLSIPLRGLKWTTRQPGETIFDQMRRTLPIVVGINAAIWLSLFVPIAALGRGPRQDSPLLFAVLSLVFVFHPILTYVPVILSDRIRRAVDELTEREGHARRRAINRQAINRIVVNTLGMMALFGGLTALFMLLIDAAEGFHLVNAFWYCVIPLAAALFSLPLTWLQVAGMRRFERWEGLDLSPADAPNHGELAS